jgi:4-hydroxy-4-methyl-2-oxoglutarate aldolase
LIKSSLDRVGLIRRLERLDPATISDNLDALGYRAQVMAPRIRPLFPEARAVGFASTVYAVSTSEQPPIGDDKYSSFLGAIEALKPDDVIVVSTIPACFWGELASLAALQRGARGAIIDGYARDALAVIARRFPAFVSGIHVADIVGRVDILALGGEIRSGDVTVRQGDLVIADFDGVVVIPIEISEEVIALTEEKSTREQLARDDLRNGLPISEVFLRHDL